MLKGGEPGGLGKQEEAGAQRPEYWEGWGPKVEACSWGEGKETGAGQAAASREGLPGWWCGHQGLPAYPACLPGNSGLASNSGPHSEREAVRRKATVGLPKDRKCTQEGGRPGPGFPVPPEVRAGTPDPRG